MATVFRNNCGIRLFRSLPQGLKRLVTQAIVSVAYNWRAQIFSSFYANVATAMEEIMALDEIMIQEFWAISCRSAQSHALLMGHQCSSVAAEMMVAVTRRFCDQLPPQTKSNLSFRNRQAMAVSSWISSIRHADSMARIHPAVADEIFEATRQACDRELPQTDDSVHGVHLQAIALSSQIASICHSDSIRHL